MRYRIVVAVCRLLGHPERRVKRPGGVTRLVCPCGYIDITERVFDTSPDKEV